MSTIEIYKRNQGKYTRICTFVAGTVIGAIGSGLLGQKIAGMMTVGKATAYVTYGVPAVLIVLLGLLMFWLVNRPSSADFLIATEGEMKKVSWSSRKEVIGSTKVVIITALIVSMVLLAVDVMFTWVFQILGVMGS